MIRRCPNLPHVFSVGGAGDEELVIPPGPAALTQRTLGRVFEGLVLPVVLPDGDETCWVQHEETVEHDLVLPGELVQLEDVVIVITVVIRSI